MGAGSIFLLGFGVGVVTTLVCILIVFRTAIQRAAQDHGLVKALLKKLALAEAEKLVYQKAYNESSDELVRLRDDKLHAWGIPDGMNQEGDEN